jgi:hypothetical protein
MCEYIISKDMKEFHTLIESEIIPIKAFDDNTE